LGLDLELLKWLEKYTFPAESKFSDLTFAEKVYHASVKRHLMNGTTTCVYFATIHKEASLLLAKLCEQMGQRAYIGKVNMDRMAPDFYVETTENSLADTEKFIIELNDKKYNLVSPIITPRFVITCTSELMNGLSQLAKKYNLPIQSHVSENKGEVQFVKSLFPTEESYTQTYDSHGLLTDRTIMAHGIFLSDKELDLLRDRKSTISHCPLSNFSIKSGVMDVKRALAHGVNVGLGTDVSGGYSPSMLNAIRTTIIASTAMMSNLHHDYRNVDAMIQNFLSESDNQKQQESPAYQTITTAEAFYLATMGGAISLGLQNKIGNFEESKSFDALVVDVDAQGGPIDAFLSEYEILYDQQKLNDEEARSEKRVMDMFERFIYNGDDRNIVRIYVQGEQRL
jgi:guanine deaminase